MTTAGIKIGASIKRHKNGIHRASAVERIKN